LQPPVVTVIGTEQVTVPEGPVKVPWYVVEDGGKTVTEPPETGETLPTLLSIVPVDALFDVQERVAL
jgi:hypothetical protein